MTYQKHGKILGIIFIIIAVLNTASYYWVFQIAETFLPIAVDEPEVILVFNLIKNGLWFLILFIAIPAFITGIGLIQNASWAYTSALIIGLLSLFFIPFWTIAGVYAIIIFILRHDAMKRIPD